MSSQEVRPKTYLSSFYPTRWSDVDSNNHIRHSVYLDLCASARMEWLDSCGFTAQRLSCEGVGPILFREEVFYLKELRLGEKVQVQLKISNMSESGHKFSLEHHLLNGKNEPVARLLIDGAWFDLKTRRVSSPPEALKEIMAEIYN